jgi:hypothetical protein
MDDRSALPEKDLSEDIDLTESVENRPPAPRDARQRDHTRRALSVYARTVYFMRAYVTGLHGQGAPLSLSKAGRYIQDLVDLSRNQPTDFLSLTTVKNDDEYWCFHSVNVAVLAIAYPSFSPEFTVLTRLFVHTQSVIARSVARISGSLRNH